MRFEAYQRIIRRIFEMVSMCLCMVILFITSYSDACAHNIVILLHVVKHVVRHQPFGKTKNLLNAILNFEGK
jgi:hypothetical protein